MYAFLLLKHDFEGVHSPYADGAKLYQEGITESPLIIAPIHTKEYLWSNSIQTIEFGKTDFKNGSRTSKLA